MIINKGDEPYDKWKWNIKMNFSSTPNYDTKQHNNETSTRANSTSSSIHNRSTAGTLCNNLKHLTLNDAPTAAPPCDVTWK